MFSQKIKASARILGVGLLAVTMTAPSVLAGGKGAGACPFTSKDFDGWYKAVGFDTGADNVNPAACAIEATFVTLDEIERGLDAVATTKQILISVQNESGNYSIQVMAEANGGAIVVQEDQTIDLVSQDGYDACVSALLSSQAWNRWACGKQ